MTDANFDHPKVDRLAAHSLGLLDGEQAGRVADHLKRCAACRSFVETTSREELVALCGTHPGPNRPQEKAEAHQPSTARVEEARPSSVRAGTPVPEAADAPP